MAGVAGTPEKKMFVVEIETWDKETIQKILEKHVFMAQLYWLTASSHVQDLLNN